MIDFQTGPQIQDMRNRIRRLSRNVQTMGSRRVIGPALQEKARPGRQFLQRNTPRSRNAPRGRIRLSASVRSNVGEVAHNDYTFIYVGWRTGRSTGIHRAQTLAVEHGTRRQRGTLVTARAFRRTNPTDPTIIADAVQRELDRDLRGS